MADPEQQLELKEDNSNVGSFDPSKKKKKKKDRVVASENGESSPLLTEKMEELTVSETSTDSQFLGLKKKKKKKPVDGESVEDASRELEETKEADLTLHNETGDDISDISSLTMKKKKKKPIIPSDFSVEEKVGEGEEEDINENEEGMENEEVDEDEEEAMAIELGSSRLPWEGSDRDYTYDELLGRVFNILRENNPELAGEKRRTIMRPPQVLREGTKKTVFVNMMELCKTMHRQPEHVMAFLLAELGTSGSLDGQQRLVVKGRFAPKNFEGILRRYVNEYVMCSGCKSPDTILTKENRLFFLRCEQCGSGRSVAPIKAGFVARVGRRKA